MKEKLLKRLNQVLEESGKTKKFIANKLGLDAMQFHRKLSGESPITVPEFANICEVLDLSAKKEFNTLVNSRYEKAI